MRVKLRAVAVIGAIALLAAACGSPSSSSPSSNSGSSASGKFLGCMVTDTGGIDDKSFNQSSWQGMQAAAATDPSKIKVTYLPSTTSADYASNISTFIGKKCGIIVTVGFLMADATEAAAKANPKQKFAIVDCSYASDCLSGTKETNIDQLVFNTVQDGFLGGYLAAAMSKTHVVATYGGREFRHGHHLRGRLLGRRPVLQHAEARQRQGPRLERADPEGRLRRQLHQRRRGPDADEHLHRRGCGRHLPGGRRRRPGYREGRPDRRQRPARACRWSGWTPTAASAPRSTASTC